MGGCFDSDKDSGKWWQWSGYIIRHSNGFSSTTAFIIRNYCKISTTYNGVALSKKKILYMCIWRITQDVCLSSCNRFLKNTFLQVAFIYIYYIRYTRYNIMWWNLPVTCCRSVVFSEYSWFPPPIKLTATI